ncbi:MAG: hypothetical protein ACRDOT_04220 [Aeromicrobium sp.]
MSDLDLVTDLAKKSGLVWITAHDRTYPVWHELVDGAICVVGGGGEQPVPDVQDDDKVLIQLRSKTNRQLVATVEATVEVLTPESSTWDNVTAALKSGRLNLPDSDHAIERWARESTVLRLVPHEPVILASDLPTDRRQTSPRLSG